MSRKLTEKQKELLSLTTRVDADLTQQQRILLGYIVEMHRERSNFVEENGYVHASVRTLKKECGLGQDTIKSSITKLENEGLITCEDGKAGVQNTRFRLTEKAKKYIYVPESKKSVPESVPEDKKAHDDQTKRIESLELRINKLTETIENLTEEVQNLFRYIGIGVGINKLNNSTIPTCTGTNMDKKEQEEKSTGSEQVTGAKVDSSSLQIIEEESHPDTNASSNTEPDQADRLYISQLDDRNTTPNPLEKSKEYQKVLSHIRQSLDSAVDELLDAEADNLIRSFKREIDFDLAGEIHRLVCGKASEIIEPYRDYHDSYNSVKGFVPMSTLINEAKAKMSRSLIEMEKNPRPQMYPELTNDPICVREAV